MERRSFFTRMLAAIGIASVPTLADSQVGPGNTAAGNRALTADELKLIGRANEAERLEVALAGVSMAASGGTSEAVVAKKADWAWHPAYQDTLNLRRKFDAATRLLSEKMTEGNQIMLYPCGCSSLGDLPSCRAEKHRSMDGTTIVFSKL